jgi:N-methylhydantoinase A/oxoprolinase/acetone carboxylase beta subunit
MSYRLGVDVGGTFTDLVLVGPDGRALTRKVLSSDR